MAEIVVDTYKLNLYAQRLSSVNSRIVRLDRRLDALYTRAGFLGMWNLMQADALMCCSWKLIRCQNYLEQTAVDFDQVEKILLGQDPTNFKEIVVGKVVNIPEVKVSNEKDSDERSWFAKFINNDLKISDSVLHGEKRGEGEIWGIGTSGAISGSILTGEASIKNRASWGFKDKDGNWDFKSFGFSIEANASGAVAQGEAKGNIGDLHGKISGKAITGTVQGEAKFTIYDDGEFNPSVSICAKAEGSVLQGDAVVGFGTDQYGIYAKADGDVLHAEAEAKTGVGYIGKDKEGNSVYGASAEASAMASVAQGKV